jgi:hypothetical protein
MKNHEYHAFRYKVLSGDSFESPIFFLQLLLAVAPDTRAGVYHTYVISMHRPGDLCQTAISGLSKVILCLVAPRLEHSTLIVAAKQHNQSAVAAGWVQIRSQIRTRSRYGPGPTGS